ncbi:hypothetical protein [Sphingomonas cavernae]|uniref:Uncharacterized protein n=1 Tax=Sphingomonas cavernae TaxID=2320861 RepID=A0A418W5L6_9SPHN|nr:hypothetical protein [Sphingomonas cavernae]RJF85333.1 hypothetical protein D3876_15390 [Sphingomonas cavernae]
MNALPTLTRLVQLAVLVVGGYIAIRFLSAAFAGTELSFDREDLMPFGAMMIGVAVFGLIRSGKRLYDDR